MKKNILFVVTSIALVGSSLAFAQTITWLDDGAVVYTSEPKESNSTTGQQAKSVNVETIERTDKVTLATGEVITLIGGIYVKAEDANTIIDWAEANGYEASEDKYSEGTVHVETSIEESIRVANSIAALEGVTTAAPKFRRKLIAK